MSTQKTANYQLNQWVKSDRILMEEFNADNLKIDDAIAAVIPTGLICLWSGAASETLKQFNHTGGCWVEDLWAYKKDGSTHDNRPPYYALCYIMKL